MYTSSNRICRRLTDVDLEFLDIEEDLGPT